MLRRDGYRCTVKLTYGERCPEPATDVDHIVPNDDHSLDNLRAICEWHHDKKSGSEGARAAHFRRRAISKKLRRPVETHPGLL